MRNRTTSDFDGRSFGRFGTKFFEKQKRNEGNRKRGAETKNGRKKAILITFCEGVCGKECPMISDYLHNWHYEIPIDFDSISKKKIFVENNEEG